MCHNADVLLLNSVSDSGRADKFHGGAGVQSQIASR